MASNDTNTNAARVTDASTATSKAATQTTSRATYSQEEQHEIKLIGQLLEESGNAVGKSKPSGTKEEKAAYLKLHNAYRSLFALRGEAFIDGFSVFLKAAVTYKDGILSQTNVNRYLDTFADKNEGGTFMIFVNYLIRFARTTDKANFAVKNDITRLMNRVTNEDLRGLIAHVFNAA